MNIRETSSLSNNLIQNQIQCESLKMTALDKNDLLVQLRPAKGNGCLQIFTMATNNSATLGEQFLLQAAFSKSFTLQMLSPSGSFLTPGGIITQEMRIVSTPKIVLRMRLRVSYVIDGQPVLEQTEVSGFPENSFE